MASLKDIRIRIGSVKNTRQITRAMKLVSAAKLRRAQEAILNARPYAYRVYSMMLNLAEKETVSHPLLEVRDEEKKIKVVVLAGDRGLCGSFNSGIFKLADQFLAEKEAESREIEFDVIGKRARDYYEGRREINHYHEGLLVSPDYATAAQIGEEIVENYIQGHLDATYLVYNEFKSAIQQKPTVEKLIPISLDPPEGVVGMRQSGEEEKFRDYLFEPSKEDLLDAVLPRHFKVQFFRAVLESVASEHGARMSAMESATKNAEEMIEGLTLDYNKARQAAITTELTEIVGGVEAMK